MSTLIGFDTPISDIPVSTFYEPPTGVYDLLITSAEWLKSDDSVLRVEYEIEGVVECSDPNAETDAVGKTFTEFFSRSSDRVQFLVRTAAPVIKAFDVHLLGELVDRLPGLQITATVVTKPLKKDKTRNVTNTRNWVLR